MNRELTESQINELLPAYVLEALEPEEMLAMDDYIQRQRRLLHQLEELEITVAQLAHAAPEMPLPPGAKARLMARVRADVRASQSHQQRPPRAGNATVQERTERAEGWWTGLQRLFGGTNLAWSAAALTMLFLLLSTWNGNRNMAALDQARDELAAAEVQLDQATGQLNQAQGEIGALQQSKQQLEQQLSLNDERLALFATAQRVVSLPGTAEAPNARATFYQRDNQGLLVWHGLEPLPMEQTYELWLIPADGAPVPAGLIAVASTEPQSLEVAVPAGAGEYVAVGVSVEPSGGSPQPTGPIVLLGQSGAPSPDS